MNRDYCLRPWCPACGVFGRTARRRARDADEAALVRFHAHLAAQARTDQKAKRRADVEAIVRTGYVGGHGIQWGSWYAHNALLEPEPEPGQLMFGYGLGDVHMGKTEADGNAVLRVVAAAAAAEDEQR